MKRIGEVMKAHYALLLLAALALVAAYGAPPAPLGPGACAGRSARATKAGNTRFLTGVLDESALANGNG